MLYAQVMVEVEDALLQCTRFDSYETTTTTTRDLPTREFVPIVDRIINTRGLNRWRWSYFDSAGSTLVFSVDDVFSYKVVERRGIIPLGPTVRFPFDGSNLEVALLRGFTGLASAAKGRIRGGMISGWLWFVNNEALTVVGCWGHGLRLCGYWPILGTDSCGVLLDCRRIDCVLSLKVATSERQGKGRLETG